MKIRELPKGTVVRDNIFQDFKVSIPSGHDEIVSNHKDRVHEEAKNVKDIWHKELSAYSIARIKLYMLNLVKETLHNEGIEFDELNGLPPTRVNAYFAYEFSALWLWTEFIYAIYGKRGFNDDFYKKYGPLIASVMKKYPKVTGVLIGMLDLKLPGNKLFDLSKMEEADFDNDHTDDGMSDSKAEEFKSWIMEWCADATQKDKMRVKNWFETKKSHKQIFAEINKVLGNSYKFNARLALFVERLFDKTGTEYFFEKTGFATKEDLFMAYFDKLTQFDEETKKAFIKKYLLG